MVHVFKVKWADFWGRKSKSWGRRSKTWCRGSKVRGRGGNIRGRGRNVMKIPSIILYKISLNFAWKKVKWARNGAGTLIPLLFLETARIYPQGCWHNQVEGFSWNIPHMFLINKLWDPIHALAFQTCFPCPLTFRACPLTFQTCFPRLPWMLRYVCRSGHGISQDLKIDLTTLLSDWSTSLAINKEWWE